jgi:TonB family protein
MRACALLASLSILAAHAAPDAPAAFVPFERRVAQAVRLVEPRFPQEAVERGLQGAVEVQGIVQPGGELAQVRITPDSDSSARFAAAVARAVPAWSFEPALGPDCQPSKQPIVTHVRFVIDARGPHVLATLSSETFPSEAAKVPEGLAEKDFHALQRAAPHYPRAMLSRGIDVNVYATLVVRPDGEVASVQAKAYPVTPYIPDPTPRQRDALDRLKSDSFATFEGAAWQALSRWQYVRIDRPIERRTCYSLYFRDTR